MHAILSFDISKLEEASQHQFGKGSEEKKEKLPTFGMR